MLNDPRLASLIHRGLSGPSSSVLTITIACLLSTALAACGAGQLQDAKSDATSADVGVKTKVDAASTPSAESSSGKTVDGRGSAKTEPSRIEEPAQLFTKAILPGRRSGGAQEAVIRAQVRYRNPDASEVRLVWGLNEFRLVPEKLPPETFLTFNDSHMNTTMERRGEFFVLEFEVAENTRLDYAFTISRTSAGEAVEIWKGANSSGDYYTTVLTVADADEVIEPEPRGDQLEANRLTAGPVNESPDTADTAAPTLGSDLSKVDSRSEEWCQLHTSVVMDKSTRQIYEVHPDELRIHVQFRYKNPLASEVILVWGLNNWAPAPDKRPPGTSLTYAGTHMNTPMNREGDLFVVDYELQVGTQLDYGFVIKRTSDGKPADTWRLDERTGKFYTTVISSRDVDEIVTPNSNLLQDASWTLGVTVGISLLIAVWLLWRAPQKSPDNSAGSLVRAEGPSGSTQVSGGSRGLRRPKKKPS